MKVLCFAGSLRLGSYNKLYARVAHGILQSTAGIEAEYIDAADYPLPVYNPGH